MADQQESPRYAPNSRPTTAETEAVAFASDLIRLDTSNRGGGDCVERPAAEYIAERLADAGMHPVLLESAPGRANVVARIAGTDPAAGALLAHGHLDVVPAEPSEWERHPFSGDVSDGVLHGRGAVDMKNAVAALVAVARQFARDGVRPRRDIVLAFTADEEDTAAYGAGWLVSKHADLLAGCTDAVSESGGFTFHAGNGVRLYPIASAERGTAWLRLTARGQAGHGSKPNPDNAVAHVAGAVARIAAHRWPARLIPTVRAAIDAIEAAIPGAMADSAGDGLGAPASLDARLARLGPAAALVAGTVRNSANPTMLAAGYKVNVIPAEATACIDGRVLPGYQDEFVATMDELTGPGVSWEYLHREVPLEAPADAPVTAAMRAALLAEDPGGTVVPYCMSGGTDAKQFGRLGMAGYGFTPLLLPPGFDYYEMFHGVNERVPVAAVEFGVRVMSRFLATA
ncbi:MAG TPA: M20/M25/M40 family metallo-hydrolase [Streptosporangiaceae bacterium]|jgi:acetylornithine deacetylase/succinyl-diaminopimelate desuccinylase-like protein